MSNKNLQKHLPRGLDERNFQGGGERKKRRFGERGGGERQKDDEKKEEEEEVKRKRRVASEPESILEIILAFSFFFLVGHLTHPPQSSTLWRVALSVRVTSCGPALPGAPLVFLECGGAPNG